ncbi:hypothetical protein CPB86DRAFT_830120 [Serendipita vermifera]|nr:hypothetical protein CPB86DRAFT_830120 [Serendipita vermifera]
MSFSVTRDDGAFELGGENLFIVFCQPQNLFKGTFWRMIWGALRCNTSTRRSLVELEKKGKSCNGVDEKGREEIDVLSVGEYLKQNGYSDSFRDDYLMPMATSIWSTPPSELAHHRWWKYPICQEDHCPDAMRNLPPLHPVRSVTSTPHPTQPGKHKILLRTSTGHVEEYDHVIMACHSTTTLEILKRGDNSSVE